MMPPRGGYLIENSSDDVACEHHFLSPSEPGFALRSNQNKTHEQLRGGLVRMEVVNAGGESDHQAIVDRHRNVMPRVGEKCCRRLRIDSMVEDIGGDLGEDVLIA